MLVPVGVFFFSQLSFLINGNKSKVLTNFTYYNVSRRRKLRSKPVNAATTIHFYLITLHTLGITCQHTSHL